MLSTFYTHEACIEFSASAVAIIRGESELHVRSQYILGLACFKQHLFE